jgi:hypothetical protein
MKLKVDIVESYEEKLGTRRTTTATLEPILDPSQKQKARIYNVSPARKPTLSLAGQRTWIADGEFGHPTTHQNVRERNI